MFQNSTEEIIKVKWTWENINQHFVGDSSIRKFFETILKNNSLSKKKVGKRLNVISKLV